MTELLDIHTIVQFLVEQGVVERTVTINNRLTGTTDGRVFTLAENEKPKYVLKIDHPQSISYVEQLHQAYLSSPLLPKLIYIDPDKQYIVYTYIAGTTHANRGAKVTWLTRLVRDLLNHYEKHEQTKQWGRLESPGNRGKNLTSGACTMQRGPSAVYCQQRTTNRSKRG